MEKRKETAHFYKIPGTYTKQKKHQVHMSLVKARGILHTREEQQKDMPNSAYLSVAGMRHTPENSLLIFHPTTPYT